MQQFNAAETNKIAAQNAGNALQASTVNAQLEADIDKFNVSVETQRDQWNAANAQAVEQSNVNWRRQANTADTAAINAANQQNVQNVYNMSALNQTQYWQQMRDEAAYIRNSHESYETRKAQLISVAIGNEAAATKGNTTTNSALMKLLDGYV
jgi:hypothetical protein